MARDETCRRRKQEAYGAGDLVRLAEAAQWYRGDHARMPLLIGARDCGHRRGDGPRRDRVDPDAIGRELKCQRLGQAVEACLRGSIGCGAGVPDQSDLARHEDHRAASPSAGLGAHRPCGIACEDEAGRQVQVHSAVPGIAACLEAGQMFEDAGTARETVEPAEDSRRFSDDAFGAFAEKIAYKDMPARQKRLQRAGFRCITGEGCDRSAVRDGLIDQGATNARCGSGHEKAQAGKI